MAKKATKKQRAKKRALTGDVKLGCVTVDVSAVEIVDGEEGPLQGHAARVRLHGVAKPLTKETDLVDGAVQFHFRQTAAAAWLDLINKKTKWLTTTKVRLGADDRIKFILLECEHELSVPPD